MLLKDAATLYDKKTRQQSVNTHDIHTMDLRMSPDVFDPYPYEDIRFEGEEHDEREQDQYDVHKARFGNRKPFPP